MPDIFLSYSRDDQATARRFAEGFEREGFSVWWDQTLRSGENYDQVTEAALREAKAVVVLWSKKSVDSRWVRAEATTADRAGTLVPAMIEPCNRPIMFELKHTAELAHWKGEANDPAWQSFLSDVRGFVQKGVPPVPALLKTSTPQSSQPSSRLPWLVAAVVLLLLLGGGALWTYFGKGSTATEVAKAPVTLAVLPFVNLSPDPEQEYFSDGLTEEILNQLAQIKALRVTGRTSSFSFKGKNEDLRGIADKLGVANLLEGSVRRDGGNLRITAQLINGMDGAHLWSQNYDRPLTDIFAIQDDIARSVAGALQVTLGVGVGREPGMTRNIEAYGAWLAARGVTFTGVPSLRQRIDLLQQAVALDPAFAQPWWDLSQAYYFFSLQNGTPEDVADRQRKSDAAFAEYRRRLPDSPRIHERLAEDSVEAGQMVAAAEHYQAAEKAADRFYGGRAPPLDIIGQGKTPIGFADLVGRPRESIALFEQARARDPLNVVVALWLAYLYGTVGDFPAAFAEFERSERLAKDSRLTHLAVRIALASRDRKLLLPWLDKQIEDERSLGIDFSARMKPLLDKPDEALAVLRPLVGRPGRHNQTLVLWLAWFGDNEAALDQLRADFQRPGFRYAALWWIWDPGHSEVRKLPGFKQLMRDAGLVDYWRKYGWGDYCKPVGNDDFECH